MRILQVHNFYRQAGGEDRVVAAEYGLLTANGHSVLQYTVHNNQVDKTAALDLGLKTIWNGESYQTVRRLIAEERIDLVHVHNTLPLLSPAVYDGAAAQQTPVVQTLHNYRLLCPAATLYRDGAVCELCLDKAIKYSAVRHRCYRGSLPASAAVSIMLAVHHLLGTYKRKIHTYIALTNFARAKFCEGGLPAERITVKPNFVGDDPRAGSGNGGYALFAGRLTEEKGVATLLDAWSNSPCAIPLKIVGDGPMQRFVSKRATGLANVEYLGAVDYARVIELLKEAAFLVFPSRWYEGMPMVVLEAMACGTPVVAFGIGSMNDLIVDGINGVKLALQDSGALAGFLKNPSELTESMTHLRSSTRAYFEQNFTAKRNYGLLLDIYNRAITQARPVS